MRLVLALAAHYKPSTQGESIATATSNPRPVTGAAGSQELRQKGQQQAPQYPLYVDQVPVMEDCKPEAQHNNYHRSYSTA